MHGRNSNSTYERLRPCFTRVKQNRTRNFQTFGSLSTKANHLLFGQSLGKQDRGIHQRFRFIEGKHDIAMLDFQGYGKGQMKKFKCSPDGWAQMAIQLAYYRMFGEPCATYESAQTRKFKLGRTETIRSASVDSKAFCEIMEDPKSTVSVSRWKVLKIRRHLVVYFNRLMFLLPLLMLFLPSLSSSGRGTFRQIHNRSQSSLSLCCSLCRRSRSRSSSLRIKETSQRR